jgi:hypothetical protein
MRSQWLTVVLVLSVVGTARVADAQLGSGWTRYQPKKKIHLDDSNGLQTFTWTAQKSVCSPSCASYSYDSGTDTETFRVIDSRSNRSEIRLQNEYSSGRRQFQGYVRFDAPLNDESLFQVFGSTSGATQLMIRGFSSGGGSIRGGGKTLATGIYGVERRINVIHEQGNRIRMYVNGSLKHEITDNESVSNYHKYGCYGTLRTGAATVRWRQARSFKDGQSPSLTATTQETVLSAADEEAMAAADRAAEAEADLDAEEEIALDDGPADDSDEIEGDVVGGCSAGGGAPGLVGVLIALAAMRRRRA